MEAKELRIGNITEQGIIKNFWERGVHVGFGKCYEFNELKPIPLTEEWLLKFGFVYKLGGWRKDKIRLSDILEVLDVYYVNFNGCFLTTIKYVHQLQNLYWCLCQKELEVIL